jgi:hypothetical protein
MHATSHTITGEVPSLVLAQIEVAYNPVFKELPRREQTSLPVGTDSHAKTRDGIWSNIDLSDQSTSRRSTASDVGARSERPSLWPSGDSLRKFTYFPGMFATFTGGFASTGCRQIVVSSPVMAA